MKNLLIALFLTLLPLEFALIGEAHATTIVALSDDELVDEAGAIVHGTIVETESIQYDAKTILTKVTLKVESYLKKPEGSTQEQTFVFYTRGGSIGDIVQRVSGEFRAIVGAEVIVFLEKIKKYGDLWMVLGLRTGAYWIENDAESASEKMTRERFSLACGKAKPQRVSLKTVRERIIRRVAEHRPREAK